MIAIGGLIAALLMFLMGFLIGFFISNGDPSGDPFSEPSGDGYPFATSAFGIASTQGRKWKRILMPALFILGFLTGLSRPVFGNSVRYGVFRRGEVR